ncbi:MAG: serine/threonine protein kinase [Myxococcales bacterium]|nr:serine/threonine protein kinase [Myxococcales bacterium]
MDSRIVDRYAVHGVLASGGMATVHFGRLRGPVGFSRTVAVKRLLPQFASDPEFVAMFVDEARLAARIRHPNVVPTLDVVTEGDEIFIVMEYVHGESLARLIQLAGQAKTRMPTRVACAIVRDMLSGLQAAHEARDERGAALGIVHRDVSPQNAIVGTDGVTRLLDFGVAKARGRSQVTREGQVKGKLAYMAPEQLLGDQMTRSVDVFAAAVVLWEVLTGRRLFRADSEGHVVTRILHGNIDLPSAVVPELGASFDEVVMKGLARDPEARFASARDFAQALAQAGDMADAAEVGDWVARTASGSLTWRTERLAEVERDSLRLLKAAPPALPTDAVSHTEMGTLTQATTVAETRMYPKSERRAASRRWAPLLAAAAALGVGIVAVAVARGPKAGGQLAKAESPAPKERPYEADAAVATADAVTPGGAATETASPARPDADDSKARIPVQRPAKKPPPKPSRPAPVAIPDRL